MDQIADPNLSGNAGRSFILYDPRRVEEINVRKHRVIFPIRCDSSEHSSIDSHFRKHFDSSYLGSRFIELVEHNREKARKRMEKCRPRIQEPEKTKAKRALQLLVSHTETGLDDTGSILLNHKLHPQSPIEDVNRSSHSQAGLLQLMSNMNLKRIDGVVKRRTTKKSFTNFHLRASFQNPKINSFQRKSSVKNTEKDSNVINANSKIEPRGRLSKLQRASCEERTSQVIMSQSISHSKFANFNNETPNAGYSTQKELLRKTIVNTISSSGLNHPTSINEIDCNDLKDTKGFSRFTKRKSQPSIMLAEDANNLDLILYQSPTKNFCDFIHSTKHKSCLPIRPPIIQETDTNFKNESFELFRSSVFSEKQISRPRIEKENVLTQEQFSRWKMNRNRPLSRMMKVLSFTSKIKQQKQVDPISRQVRFQNSIFYNEIQESVVEKQEPSRWMSMIDKLLAASNLSDLQHMGYYQEEFDAQKIKGDSINVFLEKVKADLSFSKKYAFVYRPK